MRSLWKRTALAAGVLVFAVTPWSHAQPGLDSAAQEEKAALRVEAEAAVRTTLLERSVRRVDPKVAANDARRMVAAMSDEQVAELVRGEDLVKVMTDRRLRPSLEIAQADGQVQSVTAKALGSSETELLFVPVAPCRIIDTRLAGGPIGANQTRAFEVAGTANFAAQGGAASGCGIPLGASDPLAPAVVINFIAVAPGGPGDLRAWEFGQPAPNASVINYANVTGLNIANGVIVPIAGVSTLDKDLNIVADVSGTHVVADVTGYFTRFPVEEIQGGLKTTVNPVSNTTLVDLADGACHELTTCTITSSVAGIVLVEAWSQVVANHASGTQDRFVLQVETAASVSCPEDDTVDASDYEIPSALGSNIDVDFTLSHARDFTQTAGQTVTYRLSGKMVNGAGSLDQVENSRLICTFIPD
ncbi:MAG TPA: hypothetical protein VMW27_14945 [Thermoanaerobaculia bacterium]|nr:hypothetical protein [Thermoanaerobaculia bacterium]